MNHPSRCLPSRLTCQGRLTGGLPISLVAISRSWRTTSAAKRSLRADAKKLFDEQRELAERRAEYLRRADEQAAAFDREYGARIGAGISPDAYAGMSYVEAARESELDKLGYQPRASVVADAFADPDSLMFHPLTGEPTEG